MRKGLSLIALTFVSLAVPAMAQAPNPDTPVVDQRLQNQQNRIDSGVSNGSLTPNEAANVEHRDASIAAQDQKDEAKDGSDDLTKKQRQHLRQREDRTSKAIYDKKHNDRTDATQ